MKMRFEERVTRDGVEIRAYAEQPKITDTSQWPYFTVTYAGHAVQGKWLHQDAFQIGNRVFFRLQDDVYEAVEVNLSDLLKRLEVEPQYGYA